MDSEEPDVVSAVTAVLVSVTKEKEVERNANNRLNLNGPIARENSAFSPSNYIEDALKDMIAHKKECLDNFKEKSTPRN